MTEIDTTTETAAARGAGALTSFFARDMALFLLRGWLGAVMIVHGIPKVFGGMERFTQGVADLGFPLSGFFAWAAALSELAGGAALLMGVASRPAAALVAITMTVAAFMRHAADPFKTKELALTFLVMAVVVLALGAGRFSIEAAIGRRRKTRN